MAFQNVPISHFSPAGYNLDSSFLIPQFQIPSPYTLGMNQYNISMKFKRICKFGSGCSYLQNNSCWYQHVAGCNEIQRRSEFCDVKLGCSDSEGQLLNGHRAILSSFSTVFKDMFHQLKGNHGLKNTALFVCGVYHEDLASILEFIYQGEVTVVEEQVDSFLSAAHDLKILGLVDNTNLTDKLPKTKRSHVPSQLSITTETGKNGNNELSNESL